MISQSFFPFKTCEKPLKDGIIAQPVSATINIITCLILLYYVIIAKTKTLKILILSFIAFQAFHAFSHIQHIDGYIQANIIHVLWYFMSFMILLSSIQITKKNPKLMTIISLFAIIIIDLYLFLHTNKLYTIFTGFTIPVIIVVSYYYLYPSHMKTTIPYLILLLLVVIILILNEKFNCDLMLSYAILPYHAIIEIVGLILFVILAHIFVYNH